jgi:hypothetical protein
LHIFIDETGTFTGIGHPLSISMIGALIVPDARNPEDDRNVAFGLTAPLWPSAAEAVTYKKSK